MKRCRLSAMTVLLCALAVTTSACRRKAKPADALPADASTAPVLPAGAATGVYGAASLDKLGRFKQWALTLRNGPDAEKAAVRAAYQQLSATDKKEFENYCLSFGVKFP